MALPTFLRSAERLSSPTAAFSDFDTAGGGANEKNHLTFRVEKQLKDNWCWAAVSSSIANFYDGDSGWTQCRIANAHLGKTVCCGSAAISAECDEPSRLHEALGVIGIFVRMDRSPPEGSGPGLPFTAIQQEINANRIIATRVGWHGSGGGHFQAIAGWRTTISGKEYISITDPIYEEMEIVFSDFASQFALKGYWNISYFTSPANVPSDGGTT